MADIDYKQRAKDTEGAWGDLFTRFREDGKLINLSKYILLDPDLKKIPSANRVHLMGKFSEEVSIEPQ